VAAQVVASRVVLSSTELLIIIIIDKELVKCEDTPRRTGTDESGSGRERL
jgi:hypothetical protein